MIAVGKIIKTKSFIIIYILWIWNVEEVWIKTRKEKAYLRERQTDGQTDKKECYKMKYLGQFINDCKS